MGRLAGPVVRAALADPAFEVTLLADRAADVRALRADFPAAAVRSTGSAGIRRRYDVAWFPFNGMRYPAAASSLVSIADTFAFTQAHPNTVARYREQAPVRRAARRAARFVTLSAWSRSEIARELGIDLARIAVVPPAPDPFWTPGAGDVLPGGVAGARFALLVGAREPRKNARLALEACAAAFRGSDDLLVIVGELGEADRAFARSCGLRCGEITASDAVLRGLYRNSAAVLVPSLAEGFGLVAVEAMACGAPVLAANAAALPEATGGAAHLLDPHDPVPWALALRDLLDDGALRDAARERGLAHAAAFDRSAPAAGILALLRELHGASARA